MSKNTKQLIGDIITFIACVVGVIVLGVAVSGCVYKGGKIVDGSNIAIGITIPGTEWQFNVLDYVAGVRVAGNDMTSIIVTNDMKVKELIEKLQTMPQDADVIVFEQTHPISATECSVFGDDVAIS